MVTSFCSLEECHRDVWKKTPNDNSVEFCLGLSVVHLHNFMKELYGNVSKVRSNDVPLVSLHNISKVSQVKHPMASWWYVAKTSQWYVSKISHKSAVATSHRYLPKTSNQYSSATSQSKPKWNFQWHLGGTSPPRLWITLPQQPGSTSLQRVQVILGWSPAGGFQLSSYRSYYSSMFKSNTKVFLVPTGRKIRKVS